MGKLFVGFLLVLLDFNLNFGDFTIGLIPDFIGSVPGFLKYSEKTV
ncbi:hypothetical protein [Fusibacillus kribbianus]|uniref:Uncharacterized protein n=1 Tax=Fusibacillus kribbianus TaxID=3044208 RepID=A0AAP4B917_9FIRM|nr:hypothetical protein [Ruminococcus sp. YH-rum2234]MDI9242266.1 hypothetical protein [Ruminococcus sp. YH-rum2234]